MEQNEAVYDVERLKYVRDGWADKTETFPLTADVLQASRALPE